MSSNKELQEEEREVLLSIYDGDACFKDISPTTYQYKYGEDNTPKSFLVEISWNDLYPTEKPSVNMDTFYNKHLIPTVKNKMVDEILKESEQYLGAAMTYSLFEFIKENENMFTEEQPDSIVAASVEDSLADMSLSMSQDSKKAPKKEQLSKSQKRRQWDKVDSKGEKPRGWDWMDIVKHLSQTGKKESPETEITSNN